MKYVYISYIIAMTFGVTLGDVETATMPPSQPSQPIYQPKETASGYVPHATYPYSDSYSNGAYDYLVPAGTLRYPSNIEEENSLLPNTQTAVQTGLQLALKLFAKVGMFLMGGIVLLLVGGVFTTAICSLTPICTISFAGFKNLDKESVRSYVTPDRISAAASFVQDAVGKYQRLQRAVSNK